MYTHQKSVFSSLNPHTMQIKRGLCEKDEEEEEIESDWSPCENERDTRIKPIQRRDHISTAQGGSLSANSRTNQIFYHSDIAPNHKRRGKSEASTRTWESSFQRTKYDSTVKHTASGP